MYVLIPLGILSLAGIVFLAISRKSGFRLRIVALVALALMIVTVIVCLFTIFGTQTVPANFSNTDPQQAGNAATAPSANMTALLLFVVFLVVLFVLVLIFSLRDRRKAGKDLLIKKENDDWED